MQTKKTLLLGNISVLLAIFMWVTAGSALAESSYVQMVIDGTARDIGTGQIAMEGGFSVSGSTGHYWAGGSYYTVNFNTGTISNIGAPDNILSNGAGDPFGIYDAATNSFYAATYYSSGQSYVYGYDYDTGTWSDAYSTVNAYSGSVYDSNLYVCGLTEPWSGGYDNSYIYQFDFSGNSLHDTIVDVGGASSSLTFDSDGNLYYVPYDTDYTTALYMWTADQVASVIDDLAAGDEDTYLTLEDGTVLTDLAGLSNGITVDDDGNIFISLNGYSGSKSAVVMWDGEEVEVIAESADGTYGWFGALAIDGSFTDGDSLYGSFGWGAPISELTAATVPVPGALLLLSCGLLGMTGLRRKIQ